MEYTAPTYICRCIFFNFKFTKMYREIKFRGKCIHSGEWVFGHYYNMQLVTNDTIRHYIHKGVEVWEIDLLGGGKKPDKYYDNRKKLLRSKKVNC